jgi:hypothetical protein
MEKRNLQEQLKIAVEGLAQMQEPGAGYEDEPEQLKRDVKIQCEAIQRIERKLARLEK